MRLAAAIVGASVEVFCNCPLVLVKGYRCNFYVSCRLFLIRTTFIRLIAGCQSTFLSGQCPMDRAFTQAK
jgi:hypothetical protein